MSARGVDRIFNVNEPSELKLRGVLTCRLCPLICGKCKCAVQFLPICHISDHQSNLKISRLNIKCSFLNDNLIQLKGGKKLSKLTSPCVKKPLSSKPNNLNQRWTIQKKNLKKKKSQFNKGAITFFPSFG